MRRWLAFGLMLTALAACGRSERDQGSGLIPPADAPAEPASAPQAAAAAQAPDFAAPIDAAGAGPDWTLKIRRDTLALSRPGRLDILAVNPGPSMDGINADWRATAVNGVLLRVSLKPSSCDGGGRRYPYRATVQVGDDLLEGCAGPAPAAPPPARIRPAGPSASAALPPSTD